VFSIFHESVTINPIVEKQNVGAGVQDSITSLQLTLGNLRANFLHKIIEDG
jgi:hypothetical protein